MNQRLRPLSCFLTLAVLAVCSADAVARDSHKSQHARKPHEAAGVRHHRSAALKKAAHARHVAAAQRKSTRSSDVPPPAADAAPLSGDLAAVRNAIDLARKAKTSEATAIETTISDPAARKLVEWFILRHPETDANFSRYAAFIADNPGWPSMGLMRKRAEARLWQDRSDAATVRNFVGDRPTSAKGRFALARVLLAEGDRDGAARLVREAWRSDELSERSEADAFELFRDLLTREDHRARMDKRIGAKDLAGAKRAAQRLGSDELAIVKACAAGSADKALDLLNDVPAEARSDLGYTLCRMRWMVRHDRIDDATRLVLSAAPRDHGAAGYRRMVARTARSRSQAARSGQVRGRLPGRARCRLAGQRGLPGGFSFHVRLDRPALPQRSRGGAGAFRPYRRRLGQSDRAGAGELLAWPRRRSDRRASEMRAFYEAAARYPTAYYGQLARARLGLDRAELRAPAPAGAADDATRADERVRAADMLYALGERDVALSFVADLAEESTDVPLLAALAELTGRRNDARAMLQIGKPALARGLALDTYAFPTIGIPQHSPDRSRDRAQHHLFGRTHRERVRPARQVAGQCGRPDAGHAGSRTRHRQAVRRRL